MGTIWAAAVNRTRRWLGLAPVVRLYVQRNDPLSRLVADTMRAEAERHGYVVKERRLD